MTTDAWYTFGACLASFAKCYNVCLRTSIMGDIDDDGEREVVLLDIYYYISLKEIVHAVQELSYFVTMILWISS